MGRQAGVLPRSSRRDVLLISPDAVPRRRSEIGVLGGMLGAFQDALNDVAGKWSELIEQAPPDWEYTE